MKVQKFDAIRNAQFGFKVDHKGIDFQAALAELTEFLGDSNKATWFYERDTTGYMRKRGAPHPNKFRIYTNCEDTATLICLIGD